MRPHLCLLVATLAATPVRGQGSMTFLYTFARDTSPLGLTATFQASQAAVATGLLTMFTGDPGLIFLDQPHYVLYQGVQCPITWMQFPVDPKSGEPIRGSPGYLAAISAMAPNFDGIDIDGGTAGYPADISIWRGGYPIEDYPNSFGQWAVSYVVPEPSTIALLLCATAIFAHRRSRPPPQAK